VRVPLGGRVVRGWVIAEEASDGSDLKELRRVSGSMPVFGPRHLELGQWVAHHYVAPVATVLRTFTPPNLPTRVPREPGVDRGTASRAHHVVDGKALAEVLASEHTCIVVAPTAIEVEAAVAGLAEASDRVVVVPPDAPARTVTRAWSAGRLEDRRILVGTGRIASWWVRDLGMAVVLDEQRRSHKDRQSPTLHPRTILSHRARAEGFRFLTTGPVPSSEVAAAGTPIVGSGRRWARVEVVDRTEEPPGRGVLSDRVKAALHGVVRSGATAAVFTHRKGYAPSFRCTSCRTLRRCPACGTAATEAAICQRCGDSLAACAECGGATFEPLGAAAGRVRDLVVRLIGPDAVGGAADGRPISVVTEADLVALRPVDLAVVVDADGLILGPHFRSTEAALALLARLARRVRAGSGSRLMVQTAIADHDVIDALRIGDPSRFLEEEATRRRAAGYPPFGDLVVVEVRGEGSFLDDELALFEGAGAIVFGPLPVRSGTRWLLQGRDLGRAKRHLRDALRRLRDGGSAVRVDVDPLDV
jgi:primosomal protein N' (replication factor Y)